jgi:hypothetical protein
MFIECYSDKKDQGYLENLSPDNGYFRGDRKILTMNFNKICVRVVNSFAILHEINKTWQKFNT